MDDPADDRNGGEASTATPALPPSVEEAYRRKCIQLKQRTAEVEEANEASRIRLSRLSRQAEKMRIERAFLLEQLAKRTSTNVEDSDGSPSPPPTVSWRVYMYLCLSLCYICILIPGSLPSSRC